MSDAPARAAFTLRLARRDEASHVAAVVREGFQSVAEQIGFDIPPLHESTAEVLATFDAGDATLVAVAPDGELVGTVRAETMESGDVMVRRLAVLPEFRRAGVGRALLVALEAEYPEVSRFELFTGANATGPLALYESLGYRLMPPQDTGGVPLVYLEKRRA